MNNTQSVLKIADSGYQYIQGVGNCIAIYGNNGVGIISFVFKKEGIDCNARRLCAAWNDCAGIPTEALENGFISKAFANYNALTKNTEAVLEENAALRAAVKEMKRYLPVLEYVEEDGIGWGFATAGHGIATVNGYRQTLQNALDKINEK